MASRVLTISSTGLSFAYGVGMLVVAQEDQILKIAVSLAIAQLIGALGGIALAFLHGAGNASPPTTIQLRDLVVLALCAAIVGICLDPENYFTAFLSSAALVGAYYDMYLKRFEPSRLIGARLAQTLVWGAMVVCLALSSHRQIGADVLLLGRILGYISPILSGYRYRPNSSPRGYMYAPAAFVRCAFGLAWMVSVNAIFLLPVIVLKADAEGALKAAIIAYVVQFSLQAAGRVSDYYTTHERQGFRVGLKEEFALLTGIAVVVFFGASTRATNEMWTDFGFVVSLVLFSVSSMLWAKTNGHITTAILSDSSISGKAAYCGVVAVGAAFVITLLLVGCSALPSYVVHSIACASGVLVYLSLARTMPKEA